MKQLTDKKILGIQIFCIVILLFLNLAVWYNGKDLTCDNCSIGFKATKTGPDSASNKEIQDFSININSLYDGLLRNYCLIEFYEKQGFILKDASQIE